jgi:hypothetical protein
MDRRQKRRDELLIHLLLVLVSVYDSSGRPLADALYSFTRPFGFNGEAVRPQADE